MPRHALINMKKRLISLPPIVDKLIPDSESTAWDNLGQRTVRGFVLHRMEGKLDQTDSYFRGMATAHANFESTGVASGALTDYGQDAATGIIYQWNEPT